MTMSYVCYDYYTYDIYIYIHLILDFILDIGMYLHYYNPRVNVYMDQKHPA